MSNIPKAEQYVNNPNYGKKATADKPAPVKSGGTVKAATQKTTITAPQGKPQVKKAQEKKETSKTSDNTKSATVKPKQPLQPPPPPPKQAKLTARKQMQQRRQAKARQVLNSRTASAREKMQARIILRSA